MSSGFRSRLNAEVIRTWEESAQSTLLDPEKQADSAIATATSLIEKDIARTEHPLEEKILLRATELVKQTSLQSKLGRVIRQIRWMASFSLLIAFLVGALAASRAFDQSAQGTVNFYWLILVLLGFNLFALLLWMAGFILTYSKGRTMRGFGHWIENAQHWLNRNDSRSWHAGKAVTKALFSGTVGRWSFSVISHMLWLAYLGGGLVMVLILLSARQYDFTWETTILNEQTFVAMTDKLAVLPEMMGFAAPDLGQIHASRTGTDSLEGETIRQIWATFLIGCLTVYGILPRVLLLLLSYAGFRHARNAYRLDLHAPYYVGLRHRLVPESRSFGIVDPDLHKPVSEAVSGSVSTDYQLPGNACFVGIELNPDQTWPPPGVSVAANLGVVTDAASQQALTGKLAKLTDRPLVLAIPVNRSPDRGLQRLLRNILSQVNVPVYLALCESATAFNSKQAATLSGTLVERESLWFRMAAAEGIPADRIVRLVYEPMTQAISGQARS